MRLPLRHFKQKLLSKFCKAGAVFLLLGWLKEAMCLLLLKPMGSRQGSFMNYPSVVSFSGTDHEVLNTDSWIDFFGL